MPRFNALLLSCCALCALLLILVAVPIAAAQAPPLLPGTEQKPAGRWTGALEVPGQKLEMSILLKRQGAGWEGSLDVPAQGIKEMPLSDLVIEGEALRFALEGIPGDPTYEGTIRGDIIEGEFNQGGATVPLVFKYGVEIAQLNRPQEPKPPYPYLVIDVKFDSLSDGVKLAGTITLPQGEGPFPAVVLVSGSGAQNRDEEVFGHKPFLVLADRLTRAGIAVLRYDDRGVGASTGDATTATTSDLSMDAQAAVRFLRKQPQVKTDAVGIAGHSEGGIIAPMVAARSEDANFIILMAGPGVPGDQVLIRQVREGALAEGAAADAAEAISKTVSEVVELVQANAEEAVIRGAMEKLLRMQVGAAADAPLPAGMVDAVYKQFAGEWFRYFFSYDPAEALRKVNVPVLVLQGKLDRQVNAQVNVEAIKRALEHNPNVRVEVFENLNHLFQPAKTGGGSEYAQIETTMDEQVPRVIAEWIKDLAGAQ